VYCDPSNDVCLQVLLKSARTLEVFFNWVKARKLKVVFLSNLSPVFFFSADYYYNNKDFYIMLMNVRQNDPAAYAAWYRKYYSQYAASQGGTYENYTEDRGSVHSGRSSANEDLNDR